MAPWICLVLSLMLGRLTEKCIMTHDICWLLFLQRECCKMCCLFHHWREKICKITKLFFLFHHFAGESVGNTITPSHSSVVIIEGENVTFSCNYSDGYVENLQWYRQYPNSIPEFLYYIREAGSSSEKVPRLTPSINKEEKRVFLELSSAEASDSAVYYCALRPTVTGTPTL